MAEHGNWPIFSTEFGRQGRQTVIRRLGNQEKTSVPRDVGEWGQNDLAGAVLNVLLS